MEPLNDFGKMIIVLGLTIVIIGLVVTFVPKGVWEQFWRIPGNFKVEGKNYKVYFPFTASLVMSLLLSFLLFFLSKK